MRHQALLAGTWSLHPSARLPYGSAPFFSKAGPSYLPRMKAAKMRDNELKCPLAAVISVINLIKIIRSEQKRVSEEKGSNGRGHKHTPPEALTQAEGGAQRQSTCLHGVHPTLWFIV